MSRNTKSDQCPACQSKMVCVGKYETIHVYQCTNVKCKRKWNRDAMESKKSEQSVPPPKK